MTTQLPIPSTPTPFGVVPPVGCGPPFQRGQLVVNAKTQQVSYPTYTMLAPQSQVPSAAAPTLQMPWTLPTTTCCVPATASTNVVRAPGQYMAMGSLRLQPRQSTLSSAQSYARQAVLPNVTLPTGGPSLVVKLVPSLPELAAQGASAETTGASPRRRQARFLEQMSAPPASSGTDVSHGRRQGYAIMSVEIQNENEQESDRMERLELPVQQTPLDAVTDGIPLVSLGCSCGPKLSFKGMGRGAETLPFDWLRTRVSGVLQFLSNRFEGFYEFSSVLEVPVQKDGGTQTIKVFRGPRHSFWHDDPTNAAMQERYQRRIERFFQIDASSHPILFVRSVATTDEIPKTDQLVGKLRELFGAKAHLLLIIDFQEPEKVGAYTVDGLEESLLLYYFDTAGAQSRSAPYCVPICAGLEWAAGRQVQHGRYPSLDVAHSAATPHHHLLFGHGEVEAFEGIRVSCRNPSKEAAMQQNNLQSASVL